MKDDLLQQAAAKSSARRRRRIWRRALVIMAALAVFCTTYALILPAITLEEPVFCGLEAHTHEEACYDATLICELAEGEGHAHTDACYVTERVLICTLPEQAAHTHTAECQSVETVLTCTLPEDETHTHDETCYTEQVTWICGLAEGEGHTHTDTCYEEVRTLACGPEESAAHTHTDACYDRVLTCKKEEHTHTLLCYSDPAADLETAAVWEETLPDALTGEYAADLLAVAESQRGYRESTRNYTLDEDENIKGYSRYGAWYGDPYGDWCAMFVSFCLHYAEVDDFPLAANCQHWITLLQQEKYDLYREAHPDAPAEPYLPSPGDLIFFEWNGDNESDHVGIVTEYIPETDTAPAQVKTLEGNAGNLVQYQSYEASDSRIIGYAQLPAQTFYCGLPGHIHSTRCQDVAGQLVCGLEEHTHTDACEIAPPDLADGSAVTELTETGADYTVLVQYGPEAGLPEGAALNVEEIPAGSEAYRNYYEQSLAALDGGADTETVLFARFFDVSFALNGETIEPTGPVSVTITYADTVETGGEITCQTIHFTADGAELLAVETEDAADGGTSFTHTQNGFSIIGNVVTAPAAFNVTDIGPDALSVDYYVCIDDEWVCVGTTESGWYAPDSTDVLTNDNRDYVTLDQVNSILGPYGFNPNTDNPACTLAYGARNGTAIYCDTETVEIEGRRIFPLSRHAEHPGYDVYFLPANTEKISGTSRDGLPAASNTLYSVRVYDAAGELLTAAYVPTGGDFTYDAAGTGVTDWLVAGRNAATAITGSTVTVTGVKEPLIISPRPAGSAGSHSVTFKVMIDGQWQTVGSLPYYLTGTVNGAQRAYITSGMAAQFFGDYGYAATDAPGYRFGYSYNDIYSLFYANGATQTNFCMDVNGGKIEEAQIVQLYHSNNTDAQVFRVWDAGNGYSFITPIGNSSLYVNAYGYTTGDASNTQLKLSSAANANSQWLVDTGADGRTTFWSAIAPTDQVIDLSSATMKNGGKLQLWHSTGGARYWYMVQKYRIANNTVSAQNPDGTYNIGLTPESNGDIVCYYLPAETGAAYANAAESETAAANSFWSVTVRDDSGAVYSAAELERLRQVAAPGGETAVTVRNASGILWSVRGQAEVTSAQAGGYTTFVIRNITGPIEVVATEADPEFTVQYYANIDRYVLGDSGNLEVIDTSGGILPTNSATLPLLHLTLENTGTPSNQNAGNNTSLYRVKTEKQLTQLYTDGTYNFAAHPGLEYFDKLWEQPNYELDAVLVLKDGKSPDSTNDNDWWWYKVNRTTWINISFTNLASEENAPRQEGIQQGPDGTYCILLESDTVLRLRYETTTQSYNNQASFYDYDITSGQNADGTWRSGITGINHTDNYVTSSNGQRKFNGTHDAGAAADTFAFGNANCETGLGLAQWGGNNINAYNGTSPLMEDGTSNTFYGNGVYKGCTFGLVTGLSNGTLVWDKWITVPHLFNDGDANGKHTYNGGSLQFTQTGDTYTLTAANSTAGSRDNLEYFFHPSPSASTTHTHIFTNNFWPMDAATNKTDPLMGAINSSGTCDVMVNGFWDAQNKVGGAHNNVRVPISDDGRAHNWFFGMNFSLSFVLTEDYTGPLEYIFFGDDDMWVFLDNRLICDIGGVHSSVGEYVNLRDYLPVGSSGRHTLSFFYTERGASGSTCWMSFTLPSVASATTGQDVGSLQIAKSLDYKGDKDFSSEEYQFRVELLTAENGTPLNRLFSYSRSDGTYGSLRSGGTVSLKADETLTIEGIPAGTYYRVTELSTDGYYITANGTEGYIVSGTIETGAVKPAAFVNTPYYELPESGGMGTLWYTLGGAALILTSAGLYHKKRRKEVF